MIWKMSHRSDDRARPLADRHYNRQKIGATGFVPPGRCVVFLSRCEKALWVTSWPFAQFVKHEWAGAWVNSLFRNEGAGLASVLIRDAVAATRDHFGEPPELGMVTFINRKFVKPYVTPRGKEIFGQTYRQAGFREVGETKGGLVAMLLSPDRMPPAQKPYREPSRQFHLELVKEEP